MALDAATASSGEPTTAALLARAQQVADQLQAEARAEAERLTADLAVLREEARRTIQANPLATLAGAAFIGYLFGLRHR